MKRKELKNEDIKRLNYIYYSSHKLYVKSPHILLTCYCLLFIRFLQSLFYINKFKNPSEGILFFAPTLNNEKALNTIIYNTSSKYVLWDHNKWCRPWAKIYWNSIKSLLVFRNFYKSSSQEDRQLIRTFYKPFMITCGCYYTYEKMIAKNSNLKLIVFANDHSIENRCLMEIAERYNVKTVYVQHASITERFPPLHFSYSFLDGLDSYEKYKTIGDIKGVVFLTGSPRFDEISKYKDSAKSFDLGIALNKLDCIKIVKEICTYLQDNGITQLIVRPHPAMIYFNYKEFEEIGVSVSDSSKESSLVFLSKVKMLIANESSIHLDAAMMDVPSILYNFSDNSIIDWYSYIKMGLMPVCVKKEDMLSCIYADSPVPVDVVRYFNASYKTKYSGNIGKIIAEFIENLLNGDEEIWLNSHSELRVQ